MTRIKQDFDPSLSLGRNNLKKVQECPLLPKGGIILISPSHIFVSREPIKIMPFTENCDSRAHVFKHYAKLLLKSALIIYNKISPLLLHVIPSMTSRGKEASGHNILTNDLKLTVRLIHPRPKRLSPPCLHLSNSVAAKKGFYTSPTL